jgi:hypothetical protein
VYDGEYATTQTAFVIGSTDRQHLYGQLDASTAHITVDEFIERVFNYQWSPEVRYLATHNPTAKHSRMSLYDLRHELADLNSQANHLIVPKLTDIVQQRLGISSDELVSSGQEPVAWLGANILHVRVRLKTPEKLIATDIHIRITDTNVVEIVEP